ncbi:MAG: serine hydrolase [Acidimicrobiia bacterium]
MPRLIIAAAFLLSRPSGASADTLPDRIAALTSSFTGTVSIYARNLDTGRDFAVNADAKVRTASTIKLPILCALEALVAEGRVSWTMPITLRAEDKVSGSGVMGELSPGTTLPLRDVATLMIIVSDNTATNLVLDRSTADAVNDRLETWGFTATRSMRKIRGDGTVLKEAEGFSKAGRLPENQRYGIGSSTPREMVMLLDRLEQGKIVSPEASKDVIGILKRQQFKTGLGRRVDAKTDVARQSASRDALRSDLGIASTPGGRIAMAITVDDMPVTDYSPDNPGEELIWEISKVLMAGLAR